MSMIAFLGMCTKFSEVILAVHYRERNKQGELVGGPMYYIKNGLMVIPNLIGVFLLSGTMFKLVKEHLNEK